MALPASQIDAITRRYFIPKLYNNIFNSGVIIQRAQKKWKKKVDGGITLNIPLEYATTTAGGAYSGAQYLDTTDNEVITDAVYDWKTYYANITIGRLDKLKNKGNAAVLNFVKTKVKNAEKTMINNLAGGLQSAGTDPIALAGLRFMMSASNTVGRISQTDYSWWRAHLDTTTTTQSMGAMQTMWTDCTFDNQEPTLLAGTKACYNRYWGMLQPQQRFASDGVAKGGFQSLMFNGAPFVFDDMITANHLYFLNEEHLVFFVHKDEDMKYESFISPVNQALESAKVFWAGAIGMACGTTQGLFNALTA